MVDKITKERTMIKFARVLVEMEITDHPPKVTHFLNEYGQLIEQRIEYEWLPTRWEELEGGIEKKTVNVAETDKPGEKCSAGTTIVAKEKQREEGEKDGRQKGQTSDTKGNWITPRRGAHNRNVGEKYLAPAQHWNIRGLNSNKKQEAVVDVCRMRKIGVGAVLETKMKGDKVAQAMKAVFNCWDYYTSNVIEGRILVIWRNKFVKVDILEESNQYVHCLVKMLSLNKEFCVTFVYGSNFIEERKCLWNGLAGLQFPVKPWLIMGDFNAVFEFGDRKGRNPVTKNEVEEATNWLALGLADTLQRSGSFFTWSNNHEVNDRIYSRTDHVLKNEEWLDMFTDSSANMSWETVSDHCTCVVSSAKAGNIGIKPFKFFNFWVHHKDYKHVVMERWTKPIRSKGRRGLLIKCLRLKHRLRMFNKNSGDIEVQHAEARAKLLEAKLEAQANSGDIRKSEEEKKGF
ncbi:uncharacterized protein LOC115710875 [Cannabis sativa]|uniref:uncharacterized protein LOC115710875 n=1 Tax=Cannabis sativa TaxID=3483 RepID=UPI0011DFF394|nr:uncharacterized protein LOC115710875 [Cannabis sativa]